MTSGTCSEYDDGIWLKIRGSFAVDRKDLDEVVREIERVWEGEGWKVDRDVDEYPTPEVLFDTGPESLHRVVGTATTRRATSSKVGRATV